MTSSRIRLGSRRLHSSEPRTLLATVRYEIRIAASTPEACYSFVARAPNMRVQRTRSSASPPRSPLTRGPLGRP